MFRTTRQFAILLMLTCGAVSHAQIVGIGPGGGVHVRAPFVRVDVGPYGTSVHAPFTSVYSPRYYGGYPLEPSLEYQLVPEEVKSVSDMNWKELRQHARLATSEFEQQLSQLRRGSGWRSTLKPGTIRDLVDEDINAPPDQFTVEQLRSILDGYEAVLANEDFRYITELGGFNDVRETLIELTLDPLERQHRTLSAQWEKLASRLSRFKTGDTWLRYLDLSQINPAQPEAQVPAAQELEAVLAHYDEVERNQDYRAVARLNSFKATRQSLVEFVDLLKQSQVELNEPPKEELPTPRLEPSP